MDACNKRWTRRLLPWHVRKIGGLSDASLGSPMRVVDCSREFPMGPSSFARAFKVTFGTTVARFIRLRRIQHGQSLMLLSNERISRIALACGFADQSRYTLAFHKTIVPRSETSAEVTSGAVFAGGRMFSFGPLQLFPSQRLLLEDDRRVRNRQLRLQHPDRSSRSRRRGGSQQRRVDRAGLAEVFRRRQQSQDADLRACRALGEGDAGRRFIVTVPDAATTLSCR